ncbi:MAG: alanine racemase [Alphaproteobacteria bacterium]
MNILTTPVLEVNLDNICKNYLKVSSLAKKSIVAAVVKDNAYGLGAVEVAKKLYQDADCKTFFVAHGLEGEEIAPHVPNSSIYVLNGIGEDSLKSFQNAKLIPVISCLEQLSFWQQNKIDGIKPAIQVETGLNRLGFREEDLMQLSSSDLTEFSLVVSHLACADEVGHELNYKQLNELNRLQEKYFPSLPMSLSASDGTFLGIDFQKDIVRLGASLYGIDTSIIEENKVLPVINIKAPVLQIARLKAGDSVGYNATYKASENKDIAILSIGYGDGFPRSLSNIGKVYFNNSEAKILGRVSMDCIVVDVTNIDIKVGDFASIINDFYTVNDIAKDAQTIGYEIISRLGTRFIKKYII